MVLRSRETSQSGGIIVITTRKDSRGSGGAGVVQPLPMLPAGFLGLQVFQ